MTRNEAPLRPRAYLRFICQIWHHQERPPTEDFMKSRRNWSYYHSHHGRIEFLESRNLLCGHAVGTADVKTLARAINSAASPVAHFSTSPTRSDSSHAETELTAALTDSATGASGTATYETATRCGNTSTRLIISVTGAAASSNIDVTIDGTVVGQVQTDASGNGKLVLSTKDGTLPSSFPTTLAAGSTIRVGSLTGIFATSTDDSDGDHGCEGATRTRLTASLTDTNSSATGTATLKTKTYDGTTRTFFTVSVTGAAIGSALDVTIDGVVVGQVQTDSTGAGSLTLSTKAGTLPANFPTTVTAGSTITVGTLSGTFATSTSALSSLRFHRR